MDDELIDPKEIGADDDIDDADELVIGKKKPKKIGDDVDADDPDSLDDLADKETDVLPEDSFDDVDLW